MSPRRRKQSDAQNFRIALLRLRGEQEWTQDTLAARLGVSKRTLSNWECGYWLPHFKQRLHVVLSLHDLAPEHVLEVADALGVSVNPAVAPFLQPYKDALYGAPPVVEEPVAPTPAPAPERAPTDPVLLRNAMDTVVRDASDEMNVPANELRAAVSRALALCGELGGTLEEMRAAVAVKGKPKSA